MEITCDSVRIDSSKPYKLKLDIDGINWSDIDFRDIAGEFNVDEMVESIGVGEVLDNIDVEDIVEYYLVAAILKHISISDVVNFYGEKALRKELDGNPPDVNEYDPARHSG